ncbi:MAG TPA: DotU family type IV/VI secretion system protein [Vicinamibacterales bacterium]|nr:DotU family type IV/VI secretion system protein [Vicinamibacterales bacterium]
MTAVAHIDRGRRPAISVFEQFRAFWKEVEAQRTAALAPAMAPASQEPATTTAIVPASTATRERLLYHLRGQQADMTRWASGPVLEYYRQAQYVMVAAADEVFVELPWSGASYWRANLLETEQYGTRCAGEALFARIEALLDRADPRDVELAAVYLTALALGFRGRYLGRDDLGAIDGYKQRLYQFIFGKRPDLTDPFRKIVPQCYESTITSGEGRKLRSPRLWWWAAAAVVVAWLVGSQIVWMNLSGPIRDRLATIQSQIEQLERLQ